MEGFYYGGFVMRTKRYIPIAAGAITALCIAGQAFAGGTGPMSEADMLAELKRMIQQQQAQIDQQAAEIAALKEQLSGSAAALQADVAKLEEEKADKSAVEDLGVDKMVVSSNSNIDVNLYGQLNRAVLFADNGDSSDVYFVDNTNSNSRLGLRASGEVGGWKIGTRFEYGIVSSASDDVNQFDNNNATSDNFKLRWAEINFANDTFGKFSLGKGDSASNSVAEVDLSGTDVVTYSSISDMAGNILWNDKTANEVSDIAIGNVSSNFDGLSRTDRIRYDTPSFAGFTGAASANDGSAYDGALRYSRDFSGTKVAAAFGYADPGSTASYNNRYSGSISVMLPMGLNATFAGGSQDLDTSGRDNPVTWYGKLGYQTKFYDAATTSFSVDYAQTKDLQANDDKFQTWSLAAVHKIDDWATEFYAAYRFHKLDRTNVDYDNINAVMAGARIKF
jgi:uncharacterized coiled-coil protein SlyX